MSCFTLLLLLLHPALGALFTKEKAYETLKTKGFRWRQTEVMQLEANAKSTEAKSLRQPQIQLSAKEYLGKVNPLQYGLSIAADVNLIAIGTTALELGYIFFDRSINDRIDAANKNQNLTAAQKEQYQIDLTSLMLVQFLNVQRLQKKLSALEASRLRAQEVEKIAKDKVSSGLGLKLDLMRAQSLVAAEELKTLDAELSLAKARQELATTLGQENIKEEFTKLELAFIDPHKEVSDFNQIIELRPDIRGAHIGAEMTHLLVDAAKHDRWPKLGLFGSIGVFHAGSAFGFGATNINGMGGLVVSMPLYTGGRIGAKVEEEEARNLKAEFQEHHVTLEAKSQLNLSVQQISTAQKAVETSQRQIKTLEEELRLVKQKYKSGSGNGLDVTNTLVNVANAHDANIDAIFAYEASKVGLYKNIGSFKNYFRSER